MLYMCYNGFTIKINWLNIRHSKMEDVATELLYQATLTKTWLEALLVNWNKLALICFMVNSIASTKLETFESNILLEWGLSGTRKIFRVKLNIWKRKKCKVKYVKSVIMGRSRYERYKNVKLNKRQRSNERVQCHRTNSLPKGM